MRYRCPYCNLELGSEPQPRCPGCGRLMVVPKMSEPSERLARKRKIENIWRECEQRKAALQHAVPAGLFRTPKFYFCVIVVLAVVGGALFTATDKAVRRERTSPAVRALRNLDVLAEALGRYRFHTGEFPGTDQGLAALVHNPHVPRWDGPYIKFLRSDPWKTPFVYRAPGTNGLPTLFSCGADRTPGTPDDLRPDPARFDPGTEWTNGWVSADKRVPGVAILPSPPPAAAKP